MRWVRVAASALLCQSLLVGCDKQDSHANTPVVRSSEQSQAIPAPELCSNSCTRLDRCAPDLAAFHQLEVSVVASQFPFDCPEECAGLKGTAENDTARLSDCLALDSCAAFYSCSTGEPLPVELTDRRDCESLCARETACRQLGDAEHEEAESECLLGCENAGAVKGEAGALLDCLSERTCGPLVTCTARWREGSSSAGPLPPGISTTCHKLCRRAIECGAEYADLSDREASEMSEAMSSTYVECAVQCGKDLSDESQPKFDACLAKEQCEDFQKCADEL
jgi:hypothetical protein